MQRDRQVVDGVGGTPSWKPACGLLNGLLVGYVLPWALGFYTDQAKILIQGIFWDLFSLSRCVAWSLSRWFPGSFLLLPTGASLKGFSLKELPRMT